MTCLALMLSILTTPCVAGVIDSIGPPPTDTTPRDRPPTEIHVAAGYEALTAGRSAWTGLSARLQTGVGPGIGVHAEAARTDRFDLVDTQLSAGANARSAGGWSGDVEVAASPTGNVLPTLSLLANLQRDLGGGVVVGVGGSRRAYDIGTVGIGTLTTDYYTGALRLGYTLTMALVGGESAVAHRGSVSRYYGDGSGVTVLAVAGRSVERTSPEDLLEIPIRALAVWGVHWVSPGLGITYVASFNRHGDLFDRRGAEIGLRLRL